MNEEFYGLIKVGEKLQVEPGDYLIIEKGIAIDVISKEEFEKRQKSIEKTSEMLDKLVETIRRT
jgi:hydrogenase maturation factor